MTQRLLLSCLCLTTTIACGVDLEPEAAPQISSRADAVYNPPSNPPPPGPTQCATSNRCFGAVGMQCDGAVIINGISFVGCDGNVCFVNAGSILHDECCDAMPSGRWCGGPLSANNSGCVTQWNRATDLWINGLTWKRTVDTCVGDADGIVDLPKYCAPAGSVVRAADAPFCCGGVGSSRPYSNNSAGDVSLANAQGVSLFVRGDALIVCTAAAPAPPPPPPPPPASVQDRPCNPKFGCGADAACIQRFVKGVYGFYCVEY